MPYAFVDVRTLDGYGKIEKTANLCMVLTPLVE